MLNEKIRLLREMHNWSQEEMAARIHMSKNGYAKIERGESKLNLDRLGQIAQVFDMDLIELMNISKKGLVYLYSENNNGVQCDSYYQGAEALVAENEKLQLMLAHKDELLAQKDKEIALLQALLNTLQNKGAEWSSS